MRCCLFTIIRIIRIATTRPYRTIIAVHPHLFNRKGLLSSGWWLKGIENEESSIYISPVGFVSICYGLKRPCFYRNVTLSESATVVDWAQPAFASVTLFLILLSIYYGLHQLLFGKNFYLKLEVKQEDIDKMRDFIFILLKRKNRSR